MRGVTVWLVCWMKHSRMKRESEENEERNAWPKHLAFWESVACFSKDECGWGYFFF